MDGQKMDNTSADHISNTEILDLPLATEANFINVDEFSRTTPF